MLTKDTWAGETGLVGEAEAEAPPVQGPGARLLAPLASPPWGLGLRRGWPRPQAHGEGGTLGGGRAQDARPAGSCRGSPADRHGACSDASDGHDPPRQGEVRGPLGGHHTRPGEQYR